MASTVDSVSISNYYVYSLEKLGVEVDFFTLGVLVDCSEVPYIQWRGAANCKLAIICGCGDILVVPETVTSKYLVEFFWGGFSVTPALCCICSFS